MSAAALADAPEFAVPSVASDRSKRLPLRAMLSIGWIGLLLLLAVLADFLPIADYERNVGKGIRTGPFQSWVEPLGTDRFGRSVLSRIVFGGRVSLAVGLVAATIGIFVGGVFGMTAGYIRGWFEKIVDVLADSALAVPPLVLLLAIRAIWQPSLPLLIGGLGYLSIPAFLRIARANTLVFAKREFVLGAIAAGAGRFRVLRREIFPNVLLPLLTYAVVVVAGLIVAEGSLSFLGLGIPPPTPSWGGMIQAGRDDFREFPMLVAVPALVLFFTVLSLNTLGDYLRSRLQIKSSNI